MFQNLCILCKITFYFPVKISIDRTNDLCLGILKENPLCYDLRDGGEILKVHFNIATFN